jgi:mannose-6-phosphate isomerase
MMLTSENRPWGRWEEYLNEPGYRVKRLIVSTGKRLSLQKHAHRSEHWVIVGGQGILTFNNEKRRVSVGDTVYIPTGGIHRIENDGAGDLIIIETQLGVCLEEDITRLEDDWGRV